MQGTVELIQIAPEREVPVQPVREIRAIAGGGLEGDRYQTANGTFKRPLEPKNQASLIEAEAIEALRRDDGVDLAPADSRRNIVTRGIALNHLVGVEFTVGEVRMRGVELCEPCGYMEKLSGKEGACKALVHRGGLRAEILSDGVIRVGDRIAPVGSAVRTGESPTARGR